MSAGVWMLGCSGRLCMIRAWENRKREIEREVKKKKKLQREKSIKGR